MFTLRTIRNHWKKTIFAAVVSGFGIQYLVNRYRESMLLRAYCLEAKKYGEELFNSNHQRRRVTVFLNPAANRGSSKALFEKNVAPLLHLAGLEVTVLKTEYEGQAKKYIEILDDTDAIIVAGGDGTLSEVITGLLRRKDHETVSQIPIGVIPLGKKNTVAKRLCPVSSSAVQQMAELTMSAIRSITKSISVIQFLGDEEKTAFAVSAFEWGAFTDSDVAKAKYWYFGPLKHYMAYVVTALKYWPPIKEAQLSYVLPCEGCSRCYTAPNQISWKWWHLFLPPQRQAQDIDYRKIVNNKCGVSYSEVISMSQFSAVNCRFQHTEAQRGPESVRITITNDKFSKSDFIRQGWKRIDMKIKNEAKEVSANERELLVKAFTLAPLGTANSGRESWFLLDNEQYELMKVSACLFSDKLRFFYCSSFTVPLESSEI